MSFILLDEHLRACSQDSSNKIKPLFIIKQTVSKDRGRNFRSA